MSLELPALSDLNERITASAAALEGIDRAYSEHLTRWPGPGHPDEAAWLRRDEELAAEASRLLAENRALMAEYNAAGGACASPTGAVP